VTTKRRLGARSTNQAVGGKVSTLRVRMVASCCWLRGQGLTLSGRRAARSSHQPNMKTAAMTMSQDVRNVWTELCVLPGSGLAVTDHWSRIGLDRKIARLHHR